MEDGGWRHWGQGWIFRALTLQLHMSYFNFDRPRQAVLQFSRFHHMTGDMLTKHPRKGGGMRDFI